MTGSLNGGQTARGGITPALPATGHPVSQYIKHVVVIVQENRSFENFFAGYPGANAPMYGCAQLKFQKSSKQRSYAACPADDAVVPLHPITFDGPDLPHSWRPAITDWNHGNMDGFSNEGGEHAGKDAAYAYVQNLQVAPYWKMAQEYVLADGCFQRSSERAGPAT